MQNLDLELTALQLSDTAETKDALLKTMRERYEVERKQLISSSSTKEKNLKAETHALSDYIIQYEKYIKQVSDKYVYEYTQTKNNIARKRVTEYYDLISKIKSAETEYKTSKFLTKNSSNNIKRIEEINLDNTLLSGKPSIYTKSYWTLLNLLRTSYVLGAAMLFAAVIVIKNGYSDSGILSKEIFQLASLGYIAFTAIVLFAKNSNRKELIKVTVEKEKKEREKDEARDKAKLDELNGKLDTFKKKYSRYIDDIKKTINFKGENIVLTAQSYEGSLKDAINSIKSPVNRTINSKVYQFKLATVQNNDSKLIDNSVSFLGSLKDDVDAFNVNHCTLVRSNKQKLEKLDTTYNNDRDEITSRFANIFRKFQQDAESSIVTSYINEHKASDVTRLLSEADSRVYLQYIPIGIINDGLNICNFIEWQTKEKGDRSNLWIRYADNQTQTARNFTDSVMFRMLMGFAAGRINFSFFDVDFSGFQNEFLHLFEGVDDKLYDHRVYSSSEEIRSKISQLKTKLAETQKVCRNTNIITHYESSNLEGAKSIIKPYEVVVVYNIDQHSDITNELRPIISNGNDSGIYVIVVQPISSEADRSRNSGNYALSYDDFMVFDIDASQSAVDTQPVTFIPFDSSNDALCSSAPIVKEYRKRLKEILTNNYEDSKVTIDFSKFYKTPYEDPSSGITIPIGITSADNTILNVDICGDTSAHTLILGETGSGKSVLFQDLITSCTLKYSPRDLTLYLIDLKSGGVGFNSYVQDYVPHVKSVLQNNTDIEVIRSCFSEIAQELERRGELMQELGVPKIEDYNRSVAPSERLPRIVIAIDECQKLMRSENGDLRDSIEEIIRMGRSYGVNLILATQTIDPALSNLSANIANMFIMKNSDPNIGAAIRRDTGVDSVSTKYGVNSFLAGECLFIQRAKIVKFRAHNIEANHRDILKAVLDKAVKRATNGDINALKEQYKPFIYNSRLKCRIESISEDVLNSTLQMGNSVLLGRDLLSSDENYTTVALANNSRNSNMLVIGDMSMSSDESKTANNRMRAILASVVSIRTYYKKNNLPYQISIINNYTYQDECSRLLSIVTDCDDNCVIVDDSDRDSYIQYLYDRTTRGKDDSNIDTYLFIVEGQMWYDYGEASLMVDHRKCMLDILAKGFLAKIHTIVSVDNIDSCEHLFMYRGSMTMGFAHTVLYRMKEADVKRLGIRVPITTSTLSINANQLRAIYFNRNNNKPTLFLPFELQDEAFMARV